MRISAKKYKPLFQTVNILHLNSKVGDHSNFAGFKGINRLLGRKSNHRKALCYNCLNRCTKDMLETHLLSCEEFQPQKVKMPKELNDSIKPTLKFKNNQHSLKKGYVVYADFECALKKINREESHSCEINFDYGELKSFTNFTHRHVPSGYSYIIIDKYGKVFQSNTYRGKDCKPVSYLA